MKVLLLSAYAAHSHVYWQRSLVALFSHWDWKVLSLPPRHFSWRVRGNPLFWALEERDSLERDYDLLIATSMVDLATLRGLVPRLATVPTVLYFHENQFEYPQAQPVANNSMRPRHKNALLEAQMVSLYAALAADRIVFNSQFNRNSFFKGCDALLKKLPDKVPAGIGTMLEEKSSILPVPLLANPEHTQEGSSVWTGGSAQYPQRPLRLLWVGRFEYDKGGDRLLRVLQLMDQQQLPYELAVVGQQFRNSPGVFAQIEDQFEHRLVQFGYIESRQHYLNTLAGADIVLSTAVHEFQGLAVLEAVAADCVPVVPRRLVYPEIFPLENCYPSQLDDTKLEASGAVELIARMAGQLAAAGLTAPSVSWCSAAELRPQYQSLFRSLCPGRF